MISINLVIKVTFHVSSIKYYVNMSDVRPRKAGNGLKRSKCMLPILVFPFGNSRQKESVVSLFLGTAVIGTLCAILGRKRTKFQNVISKGLKEQSDASVWCFCNCRNVQTLKTLCIPSQIFPTRRNTLTQVVYFHYNGWLRD